MQWTRYLKVFAGTESKAKKRKDSQMLWNLRSGSISLVFYSNLRYPSEKSLQIEPKMLKKAKSFRESGDLARF
jgi:hypothetical protein